MPRVLRPATLVAAAVLVSLAACASPTAPAPAPVMKAPVAASNDSAIVAPDKSGVVLPNG